MTWRANPLIYFGWAMSVLVFGSCFRMLAVISDFCDWSIFSSPWLVNIFFTLIFAFLGRLSLSALTLLLDQSWTPCKHPLARHACGRWKRWNRMRPRALVQNYSLVCWFLSKMLFCPEHLCRINSLVCWFLSKMLFCPEHLCRINSLVCWFFFFFAQSTHAELIVWWFSLKMLFCPEHSCRINFVWWFLSKMLFALGQN